MNLLTLGADWLDKQLKSHASVDIQYERDQQHITLSATRLDRDVDILDAEGFMVRAQQDQWIVTATDIQFGGKVTEPQNGDVIYLGGREFEVMPLGAEACWEAHDQSEVMIVVFTKRIL